MSKGIIDNITDALNKDIKGTLELKVWIGEQLDEHTFIVADEKEHVKLVVENSKILAKNLCSVGNFVKIMHPVASDDGKGLIMKENAMMFPLRAKKGLTFRDAPAAFIPSYDPEIIENKQSNISPGSGKSISKKMDYGSFEIECMKPKGSLVQSITAKVIKFSHHRKLIIDGRTAQVWNYKMKDQHGKVTYFGFWGQRANVFAKVDNVLHCTNMKVDKYPDTPPHNLYTTGQTRFKVVTEDQHMAVFKNITESDGSFHNSIVDVISDVACYKSCPNCTKRTSVDERTCPKCKEVLTTLRDDFRFKMYLKNDDCCEEVQGWRRQVDEFGAEMFDGLKVMDHNDVEDRLNDFFGGKKVNVEFTLNNDDQKLIYKVSLAPAAINTIEESNGVKSENYQSEKKKEERSTKILPAKKENNFVDGNHEPVSKKMKKDI